MQTRLRSDVDAQVLPPNVERSRFFDEDQQLRAAVSSRIEIGEKDVQAGSDCTERVPTVQVVQLSQRRTDEGDGRRRLLLDGVGCGRGDGVRPRQRRRVGLRHSAEVLRIDEALARLPKTFRRFLLSEAENVHTLFPDASGQSRKVAVGRYEAKPVEPARMQKVHGVDDQRNIGRVFPHGIRKILVRHNRVGRENIGPTLQSRSRKIAIDAPDAGLSDGGYFLEKASSDARGRIVRIDQNSKPTRTVSFEGHGHLDGSRISAG